MQRWPIMVRSLMVLLVVLTLFNDLGVLCAHVGRSSSTEDNNEYTADWAVEIDGGASMADKIASEMGFENLGQIGSLENTYHFSKRSHLSRHRRSLDLHTRSLISNKQVRWAEQQRILSRDKRDFREDMEEEYRKDSRDNQITLSPFRPRKDGLSFEDMESGGDQGRMDLSAIKMFNDPLWKYEWYMHDMRVSTEEKKQDLHVIPVWLQNITGKGVVITIIDDGIEKDHPDLAPNYDPDASYDFCDHDPDPQPRYDKEKTNKHGTRCAGEVSMVANNGVCGVGVAFKSSIGGIRILDAPVTDLIEAKALGFNTDHIDIYSSSWGPRDNGKTMEQPGPLASRAMRKGIEKGRGGKGVIYIWASGNGGVHQDNCACDGYTSSPYTFSFSSVSQEFDNPWYNERCPAIMAATFSNGRNGLRGVASTDLNHTCTQKHSGTSAAAPLAAGIIALVLEANPDLTYRDVKHLIVWTAEPSPLVDNTDWATNGAGFKVSTSFGFGLLNTAEMVKLAKKWVNVSPLKTCEVELHNHQNQKRTIRSDETAVLMFRTDGCKGTKSEVRYLEEIQLVLNVEYPRRGNLEVQLTSPSGLTTTLLLPRKHDSAVSGFESWPFTSRHNWGENPHGQWIAKIIDRSNAYIEGNVKSAKLILFGTKEMTHVMKKSKHHKRVYNEDYNKVKNSRSNQAEMILTGQVTGDDSPIINEEYLIRERLYPEELLAQSVQSAEDNTNYYNVSPF